MDLESRVIKSSSLDLLSLGKSVLEVFLVEVDTERLELIIHLGHPFLMVLLIFSLLGSEFLSLSLLLLHLVPYPYSMKFSQCRCLTAC